MTPAYFGCLVIGFILIVYVFGWNDAMQKNKGDTGPIAVWGFIGLCVLMTAFAKFISLATV